MRLHGLLVLAIVLAGCAESPATPVSEPSPPSLGGGVVAAEARIGGPGGCVAVTCQPAASPSPILAVPFGVVLRSIDLEVGPPSGQEASVRWELDCTGDDEGCARTLAEGEGELPLAIRASDLAVHGRATVFLLLVATDSTVAEDMTSFYLAGPAQVRGNASWEVRPDMSAPHLQEVPVAIEGHAGPCVIAPVEPDCHAMPGGSSPWFEFEGTVQSVNLTMTWTPSTPLDEELGLRVSSYACPYACPPEVEVVGRSPLRLEGTELNQLGTIAIKVFIPDRTPLPFTSAMYGTRTPVHIEGTLGIEPPQDEITEGTRG